MSLQNLVLSKLLIATSMSIAHCSGKPMNLLKFFHDGENSLLKSLKETSVSPGCKVHRNSMVKSQHPCSFNSQSFSHPTFLKTNSNLESIPIVRRSAGLKAGV
jgi:hypothetical protein